MSPIDHKREHASFRIDDALYLDYQFVEADELAPAWQHDTSSFCDDLIHLREISLQSGHMLANIRKRHPEIGHYLALLDKKIEILSQIAGTIGLGGEVKPNHTVNIGTDGMSFDSTEALALDSPLRLKLVLFPSHLCLHLQSRVTASKELQQGYRIEVEFEQVGETEHETLIRHLIEKQSAALRRERDE
ncbi:MAG TPA: PilZ domain-containing protein [Ectothiorhodospiraceae bacterium]|nr:PilZ domain-containing protein [Ectothiorhodospiraceae bacterium]